MKGYLLMLACCSLTLCAGAQSYWEKMKGVYGGEVKVTRANDGTLYSRAVSNYNSSEVFRSTNKGNTWEALQIPTNFIDYASNAVIGPSRNFYYTDTIYNLYKSSDEGQTWEKRSTPFSHGSYFVFETRSGALLTGGLDGSTGYLKRSMDGGISWTTVLTNNLVKMEQMPNGNLVAYLGLYKRWYWSKDDGVSWKVLPNFAPFACEVMTITQSGAWLCVDGGDIYRTTDEGKTWVPFIGISSGFITSMCLLPSGRVLAAGTDATQYSDNDGLTWVALPPTSKVQEFALPYLLPNEEILAMRNYSLQRSTDGGWTWRTSCEGIRFGAVTNIEVVSEDTIFVNRPLSKVIEG